MKISRPQAITTSLCAIAALALTATAGSAELRASFIEGAPKDRFQFTNASACVLKDAEVLLDLSTSTAGLIFDVTAQGGGVEVYQPLDIVAGSQQLAAIPVVEDGQSSIRLNIVELSPGDVIAFTIDVDDTLGSRAITVSGAEIAGASVSVLQGDMRSSGVFSERAEASLDLPNCAT